MAKYIEKYIRGIDTTKWGIEQEDNILQYRKVPGVWILLGKEKRNTNLVCLQVGKSVNIGDEINRNISYLNAENFEPTEKKYVNQFGECKFPYYEHINRAQELYKHIAEKYEYLAFICVAQGEELKDDGLRKDIEKYVAYKTYSLYWVNGGPYSKEKNESEINSIKAACKDECTILFEKIKSNYQEKADSLNEFLNNLIAGNLDNLILEK